MILALIVLAITFQVATSAPTTTSPPAGFSMFVDQLSVSDSSDEEKQYQFWSERFWMSTWLCFICLELYASPFFFRGE